MTDLEAHLIRQMVFSRATFGTGLRTKGVIDHIRKELVEVEKSNGSPDEWVDVVILALDGLTRSIWAGMRFKPSAGPYSLSADDAARVAVRLIIGKQAKNERRDWPDWRIAYLPISSMCRASMTDDPQFYSCVGKDALTVTQARQIAKRMRKNGQRVKEYRCDRCGQWHVGRPKPGIKR